LDDLIAKCIQSLISDDEDNSMIKCLDYKKIRHVFALNDDNAPGLNGFRDPSIMLIWTLLVSRCL